MSHPTSRKSVRKRVGAGRALRGAVAARVAALVAALLAGGALTACGGAEPGGGNGAAIVEADRDGFNGTVVDPALDIAPVTLRDTEGNPVRLDRLQPGHATAVFFGFTNCDDICPTTMADLAAARRALPDEAAEKVTLTFVTVDPQRDTPRVLRTWLDQFDPDIVGLRGRVSLVHRAERSLYASQGGKVRPDPSATPSSHHGADQGADHHREGHNQEGPGSRPEHGHAGYEVNHTSVVYLFGPNGESVIYTGDITASDYAADFARILDSP